MDMKISAEVIQALVSCKPDMIEGLLFLLHERIDIYLKNGPPARRRKTGEPYHDVRPEADQISRGNGNGVYCFQNMFILHITSFASYCASTKCHYQLNFNIFIDPEDSMKYYEIGIGMKLYLHKGSSINVNIFMSEQPIHFRGEGGVCENQLFSVHF